MTHFEIYAHDQVEFSGVQYERYILGRAAPEHGQLNHVGEWFQYTLEWFQPPSIKPYVGDVTFEDGSVVLNNY